MNRTKILAIILVAFAIIAAWFYFNGNNKTSLSGNDYDFAIKDTSNIYKIFLANKQGKTILLERKAVDYWTVNGKYRARQSSMILLIQTMYKISLDHRPPQTAIKPMIEDLSQNGIKVEAYDKQGELIKTYYIGGVAPDEIGTYMIMEGSNNPYVCGVPGHVGQIRSMFLMNEMDWRDRAVFEEKIENIKTVTVEYPAYKNKSFKLNKTKDGYEVTPFYTGVPSTKLPYRKGSAEQYLFGFDRQIAEGFENDNVAKDSIRNTVPFSTITMTTLQNKTTKVSLYPIFSTDRDGGILTKNDLPVIERYFADVNGSDFMMVQDRNYNKLLKSYLFFFVGGE